MITSVATFRRIAVVEAISFLILLTFSYLKNFQDGSDIAVSITGAIHGALFLLYVIGALGLREQEGWSWRTTALILLGAVVPLGGFAVDRKLAR